MHMRIIMYRTRSAMFTVPHLRPKRRIGIQDSKLNCPECFDSELHNGNDNKYCNGTCKIHLSWLCQFHEKGLSVKFYKSSFERFLCNWQQTYRIPLNSAGVFDGPPVRCPFPDIANHVVQTIFVRWVWIHRSCRKVSIIHGVLTRKPSLPYVGPADINFLHFDRVYCWGICTCAHHVGSICYPKDRVCA